MKIRETIESTAVLLVVILVAVGGMALSRSCSRLETSPNLAEELRQARIDRDSAKAREGRVRDSAQQAISEQDAAWSLHVRDLVAMHQQDLQDVARATARRARRDIEERTGVAFMPEGSDTRPPCEVTLTCSEAAAWAASDSLHRVQRDSIQAMGRIGDARCSSMVSEIVVQKDSSAILASHSIGKRNKWLLTSIAVAIVEFMIIARVLVQ